jgi:hypothetical protein
MPLAKRKVSFSPAEDEIGSSSPAKKTRAYHKKPIVETAAAGRPKRVRPDSKSGNVTVTVRNSTTPASSRPSTSSSSKKATTLTTAKRGRERPAAASHPKVTPAALPAKKKRGRPSATVSAKNSTVDSPAKKRGRPSLKKAVNQDATKPDEVEEEEEAELGISRDPHVSKGDYDVANYGKEDLEDPRSYWLMKAEPETRFEKGVDVRFSIDDLAKAEEPEPWDGKLCPISFLYRGLFVYSCSFC